MIASLYFIFSSTLILVISSILFFGILLFWLFFKKSNSIQKLSEKYLLENLAGQDLSTQIRKEQEKQLSTLLQKKSQAHSLKILTLVAIIIVPLSIMLYINMGNPEAINYVNKNQPANNKQQAPEMSMQDAIKQLETKLAANPDDVDGQMLYARAQVSMKIYDKAVTAYRKANELLPNDPVILTEMAESIALLNNNRSFLGEPEALLKKAIEIDNTNQKALWLYGMTFYEKKNFAKTNELWTSLYQLMENENAKKQLLEQLVDVRTKLGIDTSTIVDKKTIDSLQLNVNINYDNQSLPPQKIKRATLYLYTKATTGMPMPIAVIQKPLEVITNAFPISLTLSDLNNLQANRKLSEFDSIIIGARISYSGNAIPQVGDLQSTEIKIDLPYTDTIELIIDKIKK